MFSRKVILLFIIKTCLIYGLLAAPFTFYDAAYGKLYRAVCGALFHTFHRIGYATFTEKPLKAETDITLANRTKVDAEHHALAFRSNINTRYRGYMPTILLIALVLATPLQWKRKLIALASGFIIASIIIIFKQWIDILYLCEENKWLEIYQFSESQQRIVKFTYENLVAYIGPTMYMVVLIWLVVSFRKSNFNPELI